MKDANEKPSEIREKVSQDYARNVQKPAAKSCCTPTPKGVAAQIAGYSSEELASLPTEAAVNSFGCGNPLALAAVKPGQTVLDLGSGAGIDLFLAAQKVGPSGRVIGVDMTAEMIAKANENIRASGLKNVEVRKGIIEDLPVESASVDLVISNCVINLSPEKPKVFREIARVLKPGGSISISDIVAEELPASIRQSRALYSSCLSGAISEKEYVKGLEDAGLTDVRVEDRLVYDRVQPEAFVDSEARDGETSCCCGSPKPASLPADWAAKLAGKVWSLRVTARRTV